MYVSVSLLLVCAFHCFSGYSHWCVCSSLDYIAAPCSQEEDIHNIQSVIDSLSLDYLQISLSHITGIRNIFFLNSNHD